MKQPIIIADQTPAPGEPLRRDVHPENAEVMADELTRRAEMLRAKLTRRQYNRLAADARKLHRRLNRAGYNRLVQRYGEISERYTYELAAYKANPTKKQKAVVEKTRREGMGIKRRLTALSTDVLRFESAASRLDAHKRVLAMEKEDAENQKAFFLEATVWEQQIRAVFYQSKRLHHVTQDRKGKPLTIVPVIDHVILKQDKVYFRLRILRQGLIDRMMGKWHSALPYGVDISDLVCDETMANLTAACGRVVSIERGARSQNVYYVISRLDSADGIPQSVRLDQLADYYPKERHASTPWAAGLAENRVVKHFDFEGHPHILVAGSSGGGKSNLINAILSQLITMNTPRELRLILIDNKGGVELSHFDSVPHLLMPTVIEASGVLPALRQIRQIMQSRYGMMHSLGVKNLSGYNKKVTDPLPRLVVVIDEMATLLAIDDTSDIHNELRVISSQGRAAGVHLIVSTQHPSVDVLPGWIKTNLTLRIASRMPNHTASQIVVDSITAAHLPEIPGRMVFRRGGFEEIIQTPLIDDAGIAAFVKSACEHSPSDWQLAAGATDESDADDMAAATEPAPEAAPRRRFGHDEYIRLALEIGGSLSSLRLYNAGANQYLSQSECATLGKAVIEHLRNQDDVEVDGVLYTVERSGRGFALVAKLTELLDETSTVETDDSNKPKKSNKTQEIEVYETA